MSLGKDRRHLLIGEAPADADRAVGEADARFHAFRRQVDDDRLDVAHPVLLKAGEMIRDDLRKHRNDALRQIDAGGAIAGLAVERSAVRREVAHVGDVDGQRPVAGFLVARHVHGIVEIAGIDGVDGHDDGVGEIDAAGEIVFAERRGGVARFFLGVFGKLVRQVVGANDRQRIDAGLAARSENFRDDAFAAIVRRRKADHLEDDFIVRLRSLGAGIADVDAVAEHGAIDAARVPGRRARSRCRRSCASRVRGRE